MSEGWHFTFLRKTLACAHHFSNGGVLGSKQKKVNLITFDRSTYAKHGK
jgi:hypothetical protein